MTKERVIVRKAIRKLFRREGSEYVEEWVRLIPYPYDWELDGE